jgi:DNA polymerase III alpha subunit
VPWFLRVGSLLGTSDESINAILQSVSTWMRPTVEHILRENPKLQALCERNDEARQLLDVVARLDRTIRAMFIREGNFVVTKLPLTGILPSFGDRSAGASCGLQWSQPDLQSLGFQTLTVRVSSRFSEQDHPKPEI